MFFLSTGMQLFSQFSHFYVHLAMVIFIQSTDNDGLITSEKMTMIMRLVVVLIIITLIVHFKICIIDN